MTSPSVQFVELVREAHARLTQKTYPMYCERCAAQTPHTLTARGNLEIYTCPCGCQKSYQVK